MSMFVWILLGIVIVVLLLLFKFKEMRHHLGLTIMVILIFFLVFSVYSVYSAQKVDLKTFDGVVEAVRIYAVWLGGVGNNIVKITGFAINQDWGITNSTNFTAK